MSKKKNKQQKYSFPTAVRCPRCGGVTRAYSNQGKTQYRKCVAPVCLKRFSVRGTPVQHEKNTKGTRKEQEG